MSAQDKHDHPLVMAHALDRARLQAAWKMILVDEPEFNPHWDGQVWRDIDGFAYIHILDDELMVTRPEIRNFRDLELRTPCDATLRNYVVRLPDGSYLIESNV